MNPFGGGGMSGMGSDMDIDKMIKEIDAKIAELEKEEEEEKKKQEAEKNKTVENKESLNSKIIEEPKIEMKQDEEKLFNTRNLSSDPKVDEVIHSNMVDFSNFKIKDDNIENLNDEKKSENENTKIEQNETSNNKSTSSSDYDDYFDDFFFEE